MPDPTEFDADLDPALRAAFGPAGESVTGNHGSILHEIESRLGVTTHVGLRREGDEPLDAESVEARDSRRFEVLDEIARGGVGIVLRGRDKDIGRTVAMKLLQDRHADNPAMVQRFVEEAQIAGQLQHPGVPPVYEMGLHPDRRPYFTMKLVKGRTFADLLGERADPTRNLPRCLAIFEAVCQTVAYAHSRGVIHRDLKPSNIMVGSFGEVQVVDWGLAKVLDDDGARPAETPDESLIETVRTDDDSSRSMSGSVMGTPAYIAPEQAQGDVEIVDERADVFSLGAILCEILTGAPPYEGRSRAMLAQAAAGQIEPALARLDSSGADADLVDLARRCLSPDRAGRPDGGRAVAAAMGEHLAGAEQRLRRAEVAAGEAKARAAEERRARRLTVALAGSIVAAVAVVAGVLLIVQHRRSERVLASSERVNAALAEATRLLEEAKETPVSDQTSWIAARAAGMQFAALEQAGEVDPVTRRRAEAFLDELGQADRDRRMIERIEDLVIRGAAHEDKESWLWMEEQLRLAYLDYGIDVLELTPDEIVERIVASEIPADLAGGFELWIGTIGHLFNWGVMLHPPERMAGWVDVLYEADPDPFRTSLRKWFYGAIFQPGSQDPEALRALAKSKPLEELDPRTTSWLGAALWMSGLRDDALDVYRRGARLNPRDVMLHVDFAAMLVPMERWEEAIRYYHLALGIRSDCAGVWRQLAIALRERGDLPGSIDALQQSIRYQPDHAPTFVDLGITLERADELDAAVDAYRRAIELRPEGAAAHCRLGRALLLRGDRPGAIAALERGHDLGQREPGFDLPSGAWLDEARAGDDQDPNDDETSP